MHSYWGDFLGVIIEAAAALAVLCAVGVAESVRVIIDGRDEPAPLTLDDWSDDATDW